MNTSKVLASIIALTSLLAQGQIVTQPGWYTVGNQRTTSKTNAVLGPVTQTLAGSSGGTGKALIKSSSTGFKAMAASSSSPIFTIPGAPVADIITADIQSLADGLQDDPVKIFNYVHDHIKYETYFGCKKGASLTFLEKCGNDFDQCALLVALLQAAGFNTSSAYGGTTAPAFADKSVYYVFGWQNIPYDSSDHRDFHHWWQLSLTDTSPANVNSCISTMLLNNGYPDVYFYNNSGFLIQRVCVALTLGTTTYCLDPSFKISEPVQPLAGFTLTNAISPGASISNTLFTAAQGTATTDYVQNLNEAAIRNQLTAYTTNLLGYLQSNCPNASIQDLMGGWKTIPANTNDFTTLAPFYTVNGMHTWFWSGIPVELTSSIELNVIGASTDLFWYTPQLCGDRLSLYFDSAGQVWVYDNDTLMTVNQTPGGSRVNVAIAASVPYGQWDEVANIFIPNPTNFANSCITNSYQAKNAYYNIMYAFNPDWGWLNARQKILDGYLNNGAGTASRPVITETLNIIGLSWLIQTAQAERLLAQQMGITPIPVYRLGRMAQETGGGYYVDAYMQLMGFYNKSGISPAQWQTRNDSDDLWAIYLSALEHGVIEQFQGTNMNASSTIKMLQIANTNGQAIYLANSNNWTKNFNVKNQLTANSYSATNLAIFDTYISQGYYILLPKNGTNHVVPGPNTWAGFGAIGRYTSPDKITVMSTMLISGGYMGGYSGSFNSIVDPVSTLLGYESTPNSYTAANNYAPTSVAAPSKVGDPVDSSTGAFTVESTDLSLGQPEPRGLNFSKYYSGTRRNSNLAGMANGWIHNYMMGASAVSAPQASLGGTTPAQAAPLLAATAATISMYNGSSPTPKNWAMTALIAKWAIDQIGKQAVSVNLGKDTLQFIKQPNGAFTPPANCTATLTQSNAAYTLSLRHGNKFNFNTNGQLASIADPYNQSLSLTYNASNLVSTAKDWKNRQLTFNYSGTPQRLTSVTDGTRTVSYGYSTAYNTMGDLTSFTDAEGKTSTYSYDGNHQITATYDALNNIVVSNVYDSQGHAATQYTQGDTNKTWHVYWSGWQTIVMDPAGAQKVFNFDDQGRQISVQDAMGNVSQSFYDGQNHVIQTVSPMLETNKFIYDGNNNLVMQIDPLGFTNQSVFDASNNLVKAIDPLGHATTCGYNAQFSLTGQTNGAGDWVNYVYNTDGTLKNRIDSGGTNSFYYDTYGQLNGITYPGGLGGETNVNNSFGDVLTHTDARGFSTTYAYNNRRQLTNTIAPTNLTASVSFDAVGNLLATTDPRSHTTSNIWSVTQHLIATKYPATPQGQPTVTNAYDSRDMLVRTVDPLQHAVVYTNDMAGRVVSVTDPVNRTTTFSFDNDGRKLTMANAAGETTRQVWDARGSVVQMVDGANHSAYRAYDSAGNQIVLTNRNGKKWQFQFDAANRLTNTITPLTRSISVAFNHQGLVSSAKDAAGQTNVFNYDGKGRLTNRTDVVSTVIYKYDANSNPTNVIEAGKTNLWAYDAYNRVSSYTDTAGNLIKYRYDANGNLTNLIYPGNKVVAYFFDNLNRLTNVLDWSGRKTSIGYDLASRMTSLVRPNGSYRTINYDAAGQATSILEQMSNGLPIAIFKHGWTNTGNMAWEFAAPLPHVASLPIRTMTYDDDNRLKTVNGLNVTNDANGNLTTAPLTNNVLVSQIFDGRNRLVTTLGTNTATYVTNRYDAINNRITQTAGTNLMTYVVNPNAKLPQVLMRVKNGVTNYYIYGAGLLYQITETATATNTKTYHYDYRGSTVAMSADNGVITDRIEYSAYGTTTYRVGITDTPFLYNGRYGVQTDSSGLLYMQARYYNPYLCRFVSQDPSGFDGGLNWFSYADGNPISNIDPFGLATTGSDWVGFGAATWTLNGTSYPGSSKTDFISAIRQATSGGDKIHSVVYDGHSDPAGGNLIMFGSKQDANQMNHYFFPNELKSYLNHYSSSFDPQMSVQLLSCGSANPNISNPAQVFKDVFPDATVQGWTGLTFAGKWGLSSDSIIDSDYANNSLVPKTSQFITVGSQNNGSGWINQQQQNYSGSFNATHSSSTGKY